MNKKYEYRFTSDFDESKPGCNYSEETFSIICEPPYDFGDVMRDRGICFILDCESDEYIVLDDDGETGERYQIVSITDTDEQWRGFGQ